MFASGVLFAVMGVCTRLTAMPQVVGRPLPASEVTLVRFAFGVLAMLPLQAHGVNLLGNNRRGLFIRGAWGGLAVYFYFLSLQTTSLIHAQLLNYSSIVFAPLFALFFLKEQITGRTAGAVAVAVAGIALITLQRGGADAALNAGDLYGLLSGVLAGAAITEIRRLRPSETAWSVFFYLSLVGVPISLAACIQHPPVMPSVAGGVVLLAMALSSLGAQVLMTFGYKYVRAAEGTLITMSQLAYNVVVGALFFREAFTVATAIGGLCILGAAVWLSVGSRNPLSEANREGLASGGEGEGLAALTVDPAASRPPDA
jgi:drug/metabolite transporter (DMT)-like permease